PYGVDEEFRPCVQAPFYFENRALSEWLKAPNFVTKQVVPAHTGDKGLVRWECQYTPDAQEAAEGRLAFTSILLLKRDKYWAIHSLERIFAAYKVWGSLEYGADVEGFPVIRTVTVKTKNNDGREKIQTCEIETFLHRAVPDHDFSLSAFGLPEIDAAEG